MFGPPLSGLVPRVPDEEESELIAMLSLLAMGLRWPWGVPAQDREKRARVEGPPWDLWSVVLYIH